MFRPLTMVDVFVLRPFFGGNIRPVRPMNRAPSNDNGVVSSASKLWINEKIDQ